MAADCIQLSGDVDSPAFRSQFLRMVREWPILVQTEAPTTMILARRIQIFGQENTSSEIRGALTPMALVRRLKKLRQENAALRRRLLMQTD
jgi:hypothetical protein